MSAMTDLTERINDLRLELCVAEGQACQSERVEWLRAEIRRLTRERDLLPPIPPPRIP